MANDYRGNNDGMDNLMTALGRLQQSNQNTQENQLKQLLQQRQIQAEGEHQQAGFQQQKEMLPLEEQSQEKLAQSKNQMEQGNIAVNAQRAQDFVESNAKMGRKVNADIGGQKIGQSEQNMFLQSGKMQDSEGRILADRATKAFQPINDQAQAVKATVDSLNLGNPTGDSAAIMNEVKALSGSSRGMLGLMQALGGHPTAATKMQDAMNYINNTAQSGLQPAQRNAMREFAFSRIPQLRQQHQQISGMISQTAPSYAHALASQGAIPGLVEQYGSGPKQALDSLDQLNQTYSQQKGDAKVSNPSTFSPQPSTLDRLKGLFGMGSAPSNYNSPPAGTDKQTSPPPADFKNDPGFQAWKASRNKPQ